MTGCHGGLIQGKSEGTIRARNKKLELDHKTIFEFQKVIEEQSTGYRLTRCIHTACLFELSGKMVFKCEDLGRHNAVDKVVGFAVKENRLVTDDIIFVTGRITSEMVSKILRTGWLGIFSISSPTSDAIHISRKYNILLIARIKGKSMTIYNQPDYIYIF